MRDHADVALVRLASATKAVREYHGTDLYRAMSVLFDALAESYKLEMINVTAEQLPRIQGALKQALALRDCLDPKATDIPKI